MTTIIDIAVIAYMFVTPLAALAAATIWAVDTFDNGNPQVARKAARAFFLSPLWPLAALLGIRMMWDAAHQTTPITEETR